jgi:glucans biosynthesis protein
MSFTLSRRTMIGAAGATLLAPVAGAARPGPSLSWEALRAQGLALARRPYAAPPPPPAGIAAVTYDTLNHVAYRAEAALWRGTPQEVRFFPQSAMSRAGVPITAIEGGKERDIAFSRDLFSGGDRLPASANGFSGFRVMSPSGTSDWLAFQGASYFRSSGALDQYGLSARGLAIDTGLSTPEEFPNFTHFWLEQGPGDAITIYALLDSPRVAGAWRLINRRTPEGVIQDVSCAFQLRADVARLGVAPLTSMFWYGEADRAKAIDWRPEIHDSDGLAIHTGTGERIWRPLRNPPVVATNSFADRAPKGFGLLQRDRDFDHYQDDGVFYEKRPNLWIEPRGDWGAGAVTLVEIPTQKETDDNIVAFWQPAGPHKAGRRYQFDYRMHWTATEPQPVPPARVENVWLGIAAAPGFEPVKGAVRLTADFAGDALKGLGRDSGVKATVGVTHGRALTTSTYPVVGRDGMWRLIVDLAPDSAEPIDLRAYLTRGDSALTETLLYQLR